MSLINQASLYNNDENLKVKPKYKSNYRSLGNNILNPNNSNNQNNFENQSQQQQPQQSQHQPQQSQQQQQQQSQQQQQQQQQSQQSQQNYNNNNNNNNTDKIVASVNNLSLLGSSQIDNESMGVFSPTPINISSPKSMIDSKFPLKQENFESININKQQSVASNSYSDYQSSYSMPLPIQRNQQYNQSTNSMTMVDSNTMLLEKLNHIINILDKQQVEPTQHSGEEFVSYIFLGVFIIYIVDSFTRVGKYIR